MEFYIGLLICDIKIIFELSHHTFFEK